ncbi:MAG: hypothetical protein HQ552_09795 [Desulfobacteraceae bacterium]|nr:hypothetical protein [Desulfobacteraceae bacterium]
MHRYTKAQKKKLRELAGIANERELDQEMEKLFQHFENWRSGKISCFELSDLIHKFHQGASREIWTTYAYGDPDTAVSRALVLGFLKREEISEELLKILEPRTDLFR